MLIVVEIHLNFKNRIKELFQMYCPLNTIKEKQKSKNTSIFNQTSQLSVKRIQTHFILCIFSLQSLPKHRYIKAVKYLVGMRFGKS